VTGPLYTIYTVWSSNYIMSNIFQCSYPYVWSQTHKRAISMRFLGIILRILRLEISTLISKTIEKGVWFSSFLLDEVEIFFANFQILGPLGARDGLLYLKMWRRKNHCTLMYMNASWEISKKISKLYFGFDL